MQLCSITCRYAAGKSILTMLALRMALTAMVLKHA